MWTYSDNKRVEGSVLEYGTPISNWSRRLQVPYKKLSLDTDRPIAIPRRTIEKY